MKHEIELKFVEILLQNYRLPVYYIEDMNVEPKPLPSALHLRKMLGVSYSFKFVMNLLKKQCKPNTIYQIKDTLRCNYIFFMLPEDEERDQPSYVCIGPYTAVAISKQEIYMIANEHKIPPNFMPQLEQFYVDLPLISSENNLLNIVFTLGQFLWGNLDSFTYQQIEDHLDHSTDQPEMNYDFTSPEDSLLNMQLVEERYDLENQLIKTVSQGQLHKAELIIGQNTQRQYEVRNSNSLRNTQNYLIILNTLLRTAASKGAVHPYHIDKISSKYARKIEQATSEETCSALIKEMIRKYCLLVKNHSLKGYSLLVQKVVSQIDYDLTADLGLKAMSSLLNVNSSYLSTLFKKETGTTLTEYVNRKRIEHAIFLLNSTNMQIQVIAQYCGIPDVNYFTKIFKKYIGQTPKEYREQIINL